jgi:MFS family permease
LAAVLTTLIGVNAGYTAVLPYLPQMSADLSLTPVGLAVFVGGFAATKILAQPVGGRAADSWGLRVVGTSGLVVAAISLVVVAQAREAFLAILGRLVWGAAEGIVSPALYRAVTVISADYGRNPAGGYAKLGVAAVLSFAVGPFVVGMVHPFVGYRTVLTVAGGLTLLNAAVAWCVLPGPLVQAVAPDEGADNPAVAPVLPTALLLGGIDMCANILWGAMEPMIPLHLAGLHADSVATSAWVLSLGMVVFIVASPMIARLPREWRVPDAISVLLCVLGVSFMGLSGVPVPAIGFPAIAVFMTAQSYVYLIAREGIQRYCGGSGKAWGLFGMFSDAGFMVGPTVGVFLFQNFGVRAFPILGTATVAVAVIMPTVVRRWRRKLQFNRENASAEIR